MLPIESHNTVSVVQYTRLAAEGVMSHLNTKHFPQVANDKYPHSLSPSVSVSLRAHTHTLTHLKLAQTNLYSKASQISHFAVECMKCGKQITDYKERILFARRRNESATSQSIMVNRF